MKLIKYYNREIEDNVIYSIDKVVITGQFKRDRNDTKEDFGQMFYNDLSRFTCNYDFYQDLSPRIGKYRDNFIFKTNEDDSFWLGAGLRIGQRQERDKWKIEFNPNKDAKCESLKFVLDLLQKYSGEWELRDWDIAIDYPVLRENCFMLKDQRKYSMVMGSSSDKTEYLGVRHEQGYTKLYNKQRESNLHYPLTRLELTMKGVCSVPDIEEYLPTVYCLKDLQMTFEDVSFNGANKVILWAALQEPSMINELPRKTRKKIECTLEQHTLQLGTSKKSLVHIIQQVQYWCQLIIPKEKDSE